MVDISRITGALKSAPVIDDGYLIVPTRLFANWAVDCPSVSGNQPIEICAQPSGLVNATMFSASKIDQLDG